MRNNSIDLLTTAKVSSGLGHLFRSINLSEKLISGFSVKFNCIIDDNLVSKFPNVSFDYHLFSNEVKFIGSFDNSTGNSPILILDLLKLDLETIQFLRAKYKHIISLSPVFNHFESVDILFTRFNSTDYSEYSNLLVYGGIKYTIVNDFHDRILKKDFVRNLNHQNCLNIAISMGGADADNLTLKIIRSIIKLDFRLRIWVVLGEGYQHSIDEINKLIESRMIHDFVIVKSKMHFWEVIKNCNLGVFAGGVTMYESFYIGLPSVNFTVNTMQFELLKNEFNNNENVINFGEVNESSLTLLKEKLLSFVENKTQLIGIHSNLKKLVDGKGAKRIIEEICKLD